MLRRALLVTSVVLFAAVLLLWLRTSGHIDSVAYLSKADTLYTVSTTDSHELVVEQETNANSHRPTYNPISSDPPHAGWKFSSTTPEEWLFGPPPLPPDNQVMVFTAFVAYPGPPVHHLLGLSWFTDSQQWMSPGSDGSTVVQRSTSLSIPLWMLLAIFAAPSLFELTVRIRRRRRLNSNLCRICGYDLRCSPDRCPECGSARSLKSSQLSA